MKLLNTIGWVALAALVLTGAASAQSGYTSVTATVTDVSGNPYAGGRYQITFVYQGASGNKPLLSGSVFQQQVSGSLDSSGRLAVSLADNNAVTPGPSQWNFQICAASGAPCFSALLTITGSSQDISSALTAVAPPLHAFSGGTVFGGITATGSIQAQSIEQVRYADQFPGSDIGAKINAAIANCPTAGCTIRVPAGSYSFATTILINAPVWLRGDGAQATTLTYTGTGDAIDVQAGSAGPYRNGGIAGIALIGNSNASAVGIHQVNTIGFSYQDLSVESFTGTNGAGIWLDNENTNYCPTCASGFSERWSFDGVSLFQNTTGLKFSRGGTTSTNSFDYGWARGLHLQINNGQTGIAIIGTGTPDSAEILKASEFDFDANICLTNPTGTGGTVMSITNGGQLYQSFVHAGAEQSCGTTPGTFFSIDGTSYLDAWGSYQGALAVSVASGGTFQFGVYGPLYVLSSNAPTGNTGVTGMDTSKLLTPLTLGGNTTSAIAGWGNLSLTGEWSSGGQLNESMPMGGQEGTVAGLGFDYGTNIQHPISWSFTGDATAWGWYNKTNGNTPISAAGLGAWLTGNNATPSWSFFGKAFVTEAANPAQSGVLRLANADLIAWRSSGNTADLTLGPPTASGNAAITSQLPLSGTTANIGGAALGAGACTTGTVAVTGATTAMAVAVSPAADPGAGFAWEGWVSAAGTVTVRLCNITAGSLTPTAEAYNVRVIQ